MKEGIKEIKELIEGIKILKAIGAKAMEDGKLDWQDSALLIDLGGAMPALMLAFNGLDQAAKEGKDIDVEEAKEILAMLYSL